MRAAPTRTVRVGDREVTVARLDDGRLQVERQTFTVVSAGPGVVRVEADDGVCWLVHLAGTPEDRWIHVNGHVAQLQIDEAAAPRRRGAPEQALAAPMPATVLAVLVAPGQDVRAGDTLVMLEAMKMELPIRAPRDGRVIAVRCDAGERVEPGVALVELG